VVHYHGDSAKGSANETVKAVKTAGGDAFATQGDLTKVPAVVELFDEAVKRFGRVDIAINTVGRVLKKPIVETTEEEYDSMFAINSKAEFTPRVALTERERADLVFGVKVVLQDSAGFLKPGLPATVEIHTSEAP